MQTSPPAAATVVQLTPLIVAAIAFAGSIIGSAVGGLVTWITARSKLRNERAFDRQLEWHETTYRALNGAADKMLDALFVYGQGSPENITPLVSAMSALDPVRACRADARLFAARDVEEELNSAFEVQFLALAKQQQELVSHGNTVEKRDAVVQGFNAVRNLLTRSAVMVSDAHRRHLGLKAVTRGANVPVQIVVVPPPTTG